MNHTTITVIFFISLIFLMPAGLILMIRWAFRIYQPVFKKPSVDLNEVMLKAVVFMFPGYFALVLFSLPAIYFNYLLKQEKFCQQMIKVNKMTETNADLEEKCGSLDINELLENSRMEKQ